jgi:hypothetical protein
MDPFLEDPGLRPEVHHGLISEMQAALNLELLPKYRARVEQRVYISDDYDPGRKVLLPDLGIALVPARQGHAPILGNRTSVDVVKPIVTMTLVDDEIHEARLELVDRERRQVVTVIEVLSPSNKIAG